MLATFAEVMGQSYLEIDTDQFPLAQRVGSSRMKLGRIVLLSLFGFLLFTSWDANAGNEPSSDQNKVVWQNPTPQLSQNAMRSLLAAKLGGLDSGGYMLVLVRIDAGKAMEVRSLMSSGSLVADKEICQSVLDHWVFNPNATGVYKFPVLLPAGL
jgi:hypothetical protein